MATHFYKKFIKQLDWILLNFPALLMLITLIYNPQLWKPLTSYSGYASVGFLVLVLALNPLKALFPTSVFLKKINRFRRIIGVAAFSYAVIHLLCFFIKRNYSLADTLFYFLHPAILPAVISFIIFGLLTLTSNNASIKKLGFLSWKRLHNTVYIAEGLILIHMLILGNVIYTLLIFIPLVSIQVLRKRIKKEKTRPIPL